MNDESVYVVLQRAAAAVVGQVCCICSGIDPRGPHDAFKISKGPTRIIIIIIRAVPNSVFYYSVEYE